MGTQVERTQLDRSNSEVITEVFPFGYKTEQEHSFLV